MLSQPSKMLFLLIAITLRLRDIPNRTCENDTDGQWFQDKGDGGLETARV